MKKITFLLLIITLISVSACQRRIHEYAFPKDDKEKGVTPDNVKYDHTFDKNVPVKN